MGIATLNTMDDIPEENVQTCADYGKMFFYTYRERFFETTVGEEIVLLGGRWDGTRRQAVHAQLTFTS
ncbi:hypothetical protein SERLADRAFT_442252 [Serpula lacrymans var. lacrymans S7.9]|uniref:Uncharacterized protein n=1 Tax=Serpula lacrymans var. lacrymans (strain S7.9) TaxID=578457 RepID=F8P8W3_SERL9|nr:uncharacterized protein SERLADRAFT_442252 [Serpula lacrymans var. lacrymans S7.9]EGO20869.1 hypothetical protein SERLADRAFT_442252 [Serpula lacrymans var. lacrymans S7.9]